MGTAVLKVLANAYRYNSQLKDITRLSTEPWTEMFFVKLSIDRAAMQICSIKKTELQLVVLQQQFREIFLSLSLSSAQ